MGNSNIGLEALKSHLFETLEGVKNLSDPEASPCEKVTVEQAKQIVGIADSIIEIYKTQVEAIKIFSTMEDIASTGDMLKAFGVTDKENIKQIGF